MKRLFPGYYRPTNEESQQLWETATFSFDANVFLTVYGYSRRTRETLLKTLESIKDRLWMPHQFAAEYQRNRARTILDQMQHYRDVLGQLDKIGEAFRSRKRHPFVGKKSLERLLALRAEIEKGERAYSTLLSDDPILKRLSEILDGKVGAAPSEAQMTELTAQGQTRYKLRTPPGYMDSGKAEPGCYGDYFGWKQLLEYGATQGCALILVTADEKEDWWLTERSHRIGPRPELVAEYLAASNRPFYMYSLERFLERAREFLGQTVTPSALQEIRERTKPNDRADAKSQAAMEESKPSTPIIGDDEAKSAPGSTDGEKSPPR